MQLITYNQCLGLLFIIEKFTSITSTINYNERHYIFLTSEKQQNLVQ